MWDGGKIFSKKVGGGVHTMNITYDLLKQFCAMVKWMRGTFEFDQRHKQAEIKMEATGKISGNK